jgi:AmmeMemoRadiSam system protein B
MSKIRKPAVAGQFYPADPDDLRAVIARYLQEAPAGVPAPKAMIVPHAGYLYSGPVAASAYACLAAARHRVTSVVLLGPAHWVLLHGLAASHATFFATPLGMIPVDEHLIDAVTVLPQVHIMEEAHASEHSLEVQLPFLQEVLNDFSLVPLVVGEATPEEVGEVLDTLWDGAETCVVISSDLSHYYEYHAAQRIDRATSRAIEALRPQDIRAEQACGRHAVRGLLQVARQRGLHAMTLDLRNSGDTAGPRDRVVGYGAYVFTE